MIGMLVFLINGDRARVRLDEIAAIRERRATVTLIMRSGHEFPLDHARYKTIEQTEKLLGLEE